MRCHTCGKPFRQDDAVIAVQRYIENERRGDFVTTLANAYIHASHVEER